MRVGDPGGLTVVGVDGSDEGAAAVRWAVSRAAETGGRLLLLHAYTIPVMVPAAPFAGVVSPQAQQAYADAARVLVESAADAARAQAPEVDVDARVVVGGAAQALIESSADAAAVVIGSRGHGGFAGLLLGSVGVQVSSHAACPTVVVRGQDRPAGGPVAVGVDGSPSSLAALRFAFAEAARRRLPVAAVCAWTPPQPTGMGEAFAVILAPGHEVEDYERAAHEVLESSLRPLREAFPDVEVRAYIAQDTPAAALLAIASEASMVVVGSRGHGGFHGLLLGSTSQSVLHHAPCPVAVIRPESGARS